MQFEKLLNFTWQIRHVKSSHGIARITRPPQLQKPWFCDMFRRNQEWVSTTSAQIANLGLYTRALRANPSNPGSHRLSETSTRDRHKTRPEDAVESPAEPWPEHKTKHTRIACWLHGTNFRGLIFLQPMTDVP